MTGGERRAAGSARDSSSGRAERIVGRYAMLGEIAAGGMATVHFGRLLGPVGFSRTVAIKRLHPQFAKDPEFVAMLLDEARLATRIQHPNVVGTLDIVALEGELLVVLEYVHGESLSRLLRQAKVAKRPVPLRIVAALASGVLHGLHAAHEARSELGEPLSIVHRDVSPQNVLVGVDGVARVLDFGIAKAAGRVQQTREGQIKGKLAYMSPEQVSGAPVDRRSDIYSASIVLWEALTGRRLFTGENEGVLYAQVTRGARQRPSELVPDLPPALDEIVMRGLAHDAADRYATAWDMAVAIEELLGLASPRQVGEWVTEVASERMASRTAQVKEVESLSTQDFLTEPTDGITRVDPGDADRASLSISIPVPGGGATTAEPTTGGGMPPLIEPVVRRKSAFVFLAGLGATALLIGLGWLIGHKDPVEAGPSIVAIPSLSGSSLAPSALASSSPAPALAATPSIAPSAPVAGPSAAAAPSARPLAARPPKPPSAAPCNPPFRIDEAGIRQIKPECL